MPPKKPHTSRRSVGSVRVRTRSALLDRLKAQGPQDATRLARHLKVTPMAVRQHLYALRKQRLVGFQVEPRPLGRPAKLWNLTREAETCFQDGHAQLAVQLLKSADRAFSEGGARRLVETCRNLQAETYRRALTGMSTLRSRVRALARLRAREGYMASMKNDGKGGFLLLENHCCIAAAARACEHFCRTELDLLRAVLGNQARVEQVENIVRGNRRCAFHITPSKD